MSDYHNGKQILRYAWYSRQFGPMMTQSDLMTLGWTKSAIRDELGEPDCYGRNPRGGAYVHLFSEARVFRAKLKVV